MNPITNSPAPPNILVVDDTPANLKLLAVMLKHHGYNVRPAPSGKLALEAAKHEPPDLILLDINMPEINGYEVCQQLKANDALKSIPIIFISALDDIFDKVKAFSVGGVDYITKPFQFEEVVSRVSTHIALRRQERQLQESLAQLQELEHLRDSLVHMIIHDMRSPLAVVEMCIHLLEKPDTLPKNQIAEVVTKAGNATYRLNEMITQLLDINRLEAGQMPIKKEAHDLNITLHATRRTFSALANGRQITLDIPDPSKAIYDEEIISRIVGNLLSNAFKFTSENGKIAMVVTQEGDHYRVAIKDNGRGIALEHQQKIFEKFWQAELRSKRVGTGLGLAFCKLAVEAHGGQIGVQSQLNQGSTFWFTLPIGNINN
mgnify:CR=1 FL=1